MSRTAKYYALGLVSALIAPFLLFESVPVLTKVVILFAAQVLFMAAGYQLGRRESEHTTKAGTT